MTLIDLMQHNAVVFYGVVGFIALMVGSFLNVVIHRLPIMMEREWKAGLAELDAEAIIFEQEQSATAFNTAAAGGITTTDNENLTVGGSSTTDATAETFNLAVPRSRCPTCDSEISSWQNVPIASYLILGGKCGNCKTKISLRYPLVEFFTMLLSLIVAWHFGPTPAAVLGIIVTWFLISMSMIDFDTQLLPDSLTLPLMWIGLLAALLPVFTDLRSAVIGAAAGYMTLWTIYQLFKIITGKEGMGYGDFKLLAALGALLGWQTLPAIILLSSLVGAVVGLSLIALTGRDKDIPIPFGPYLAAAGWIAMLWGESLTNWYYGILA